MSANEGPSRKEFARARSAPFCDEACELEHGDQGYSDTELELFRTRFQLAAAQLKIAELEQKLASMTVSCFTGT